MPPKTRTACRTALNCLAAGLALSAARGRLDAAVICNTPYLVSTVAGVSPYGSADGPALDTSLQEPVAVAVDAAGDLFVADEGDNTIREVTAAGETVLIAGTSGEKGSSDGAGSAATFNAPSGIAVDGDGNLYVADTNNDTIRKVTPAGIVSTLAGLAGNGGDVDGTGSAAQFNEPTGIAADGSGNVYVADFRGDTIRKITPSGVVTTLAGLANTYGSANGTGSAASFDFPIGVALDSTGNVYVIEQESGAVRMVTQQGVVSTIAQNASLRLSTGVALDPSGDIYVSSSLLGTICKVGQGGSVEVFAGGSTETSYADGTGTAAAFKYPAGLAVDGSGNLYVADSGNGLIREATPAAVVSTFAGTFSAGSTDGTGDLARFSEPEGLVVDTAGNIYAADTENSTIRKITPDGVVTTFAGLADNPGAVDGTGSGARFAYPTALAIDASNNIYVADTTNALVRKITPSGAVSTLAGQARVYGDANGTGSQATLNGLVGIAVDKAGNLYVTDNADDIIREITPSGQVTTIVGKPGVAGSADGVGSAATLSTPSAIAIDSNGTLYISDSGKIRKITAGWAVTTIAGGGNSTTGPDGIGSAATFDGANGLAIDAAGDIYVADTGDNAIRLVTPLDSVTTLAGGATGFVTTTGNYADGLGLDAYFEEPTGIAVDAAGILYVADSGNNCIRKCISPLVSGAPVVTAEPQPAAVDALSAVTFSVSATGSGPLTYQWYLNGNQISGATSPSYAIASATSANAGTYTCAVTNASGTIFTTPAVLKVTYLAPIITAGPSNVTAITGSPVTLSVTATGTAPLSYQWKMNGTAIAGATSPTYTINPVWSYYDAYYTCVVTNQTGSVTSNFITIVALPEYQSPYVISTLAGQPGVTGLANGAGLEATFDSPIGIAADPEGNLYVTDALNSEIRRITASGQVSTVAGSPQNGPGDPISKDGPASSALFGIPDGIAIDSSGNLYVVDSFFNTVRKITPAGMVSTLAGSPTDVAGSKDGTGSVAQFNVPSAIAVDGSGNLYVTDTGNSTVRKVTPSGAVTTIAGTPGVVGYSDGTGSAALFDQPYGIAIDASGNLFVGDADADTIRKITPAGVVTTVVGAAYFSGSDDGNGILADTDGPGGLAFDSSGNLFFADTGNNTLRVFSPSGAVTTLAGLPLATGTTDGVGVDARFNTPIGITVGPNGAVYIADNNNNTVRLGVPSTVPVFSRQPASQSVAAGATVVFNAQASSASAITYSWTVNGQTLADGTFGSTTISGSTGPNLVITGPTTANEGTYACTVIGLNGVSVSQSATLTVDASAADFGHLTNISCRAVSGTGSNELIAGYEVGGQGTSGSLPVLIRGSGPALAQFGVTGVLPDPELSLDMSNPDGTNTAIGSDAGWAGDPGIAAAAASVGAFSWGTTATPDSAILQTLAGGAYTAQVVGKSGDTGVALAEVYDASAAGSFSAASPRLTNISARVEVGTGGNILIAGFVIGGTTSATVLVRGSGPALTPFGVSGVLPDPELLLYRSNGDGTNTLMATNTGWGGDAQITFVAESVGAFSWGPAATPDSAILATLSPGAYTVEVEGAKGDTGVALVEVYAVP